MAEVITLTLPDQAASILKEIAQNSGRTLESVLLEWIESQAKILSGSDSMFSEETTYYIYTPEVDAAASQAILEELEEYKAHPENAA